MSKELQKENFKRKTSKEKGREWQFYPLTAPAARPETTNRWEMI
jgi:hypothetical protein